MDSGQRANGDHAMSSTKNIILDGFLEEARQTRFVLSKAEGTNLFYTPSDNLRALKELANHLAQIPRIDTAIYSGEVATVEDAQALEKELTGSSVSEMVENFDSGLEYAKAFFQDMSEKDFLEAKMKPFYQREGTKTWPECLQEMTSHLAMHKMQLWMYLKISGKPVDMYTYYGAKT